MKYIILVVFLVACAGDIAGQAMFTGTRQGDSLVIDLTDARLIYQVGASARIQKADKYYTVDQDADTVAGYGCNTFIKLTSRVTNKYYTAWQTYYLNRLFVEKIYTNNGKANIVTKDLNYILYSSTDYDSLQTAISECPTGDVIIGGDSTAWESQTLTGDVDINMAGYDVTFDNGGEFLFSGDSLIFDLPSGGRLYAPLYMVKLNGVAFAPYSLPDTITAAEDGYIMTYNHPGQLEMVAPATLQAPDTTQIGITIDGQGGLITTGVKGYFRVPFDCEIIGWTILETSATPLAGSIVIDCWTDTYANYPPTVADAIFASKPTLSSAIKNTSNSPSFTGSQYLYKGSMIGYNVDSITTCQRVVLSIHVVK